MYKTLSPGAIGVKAETIEAGLAAATLGGFGGLEVPATQIADAIDQRGVDAVKKQFAESRIRSAAFGLPTDWRSSEANWRRDLELLPRLAKSAAAIGITRTFTWIMPCSNDRPMAENRAFHVERFKPISKTLGEHGISLGLEFIGPKTLRDSQKYPFIYKMGDMLAMARDIGPNVGVLLDCWHWYTSGGTLDELKALKPEQVVYVHVNDAPRGVEIDQQLDNVRDLPGATGVIDITGFLQALQQIGYAGPITPEPFKKELGDLPNDQARLTKVGAAMNDIFAKARLS
jgi:sugar phosphate isomerase/epimerase